MKPLVAVSLVVAGLIAGTQTAAAAYRCGPRDKIIEVLGSKYLENRQALGLSGNALVVELFVSAAGTWTVTSTNTQGVTCVIAAGEAWQQAPKQLAGLDS